jgi:hypothetical protein
MAGLTGGAGLCGSPARVDLHIPRRLQRSGISSNWRESIASAPRGSDKFISGRIDRGRLTLGSFVEFDGIIA